MNAYLRPQVSCRRYPAVIRQKKKMFLPYDYCITTTRNLWSQISIHAMK